MKKKYLKRLWQNAPLSWAIIRTQECELLAQQKYNTPILEIGCGDGFVSSVIFDNKKESIDVGIDISTEELRRAQKTGMYKKLLQVDITKNSFTPRTFNTVFANGVLEHIPNLELTMLQISRILKKNGALITTSPTDNYTRLLFYYRIFNAVRFSWLAQKYAEKLNQTFAHQHLLSLNTWRKMGNRFGLHIEKYVYYNNDQVIALHDLCLPLSYLSKILKKHTDSMVLFPRMRAIALQPFIGFIAHIIDKKVPPQQNASILILFRKK